MSGLSPASILYDASGNAVGVVQDGSIYRLQSDSKIAKKVTSGDLEHLRVLDDTGSIKATLYNPDGSAVSFAAAPDDPTGIKCDFFRRALAIGDNSDLRVDGSTTPVDFTFEAIADYELIINEVGFVMAARRIVAGSEKFAGLSALVNGVICIYYNGTAELEMDRLNVNEDFMHFASPGGYNFWPLNKDQIIAQRYLNGVIRLAADSTEKLILRIADDLASGIDYFKCRVKAVAR